MTSAISKIRDLIGDNLETGLQDLFTYYTSNIFELSEKNVDSTSILVYVNGVLKTSANYTYDANTRTITYTGSLVSGNSVLIKYSAYLKYSDAELRSYAKAAMTRISVAKYTTFRCESDVIIFPTPTESERNLIALIASFLIGGSINQWKSPEINIMFQDDISIDEKISKIMRQFNKSYGVLTFVKYDEKVPPEENWDL